MNPRRVYNYFQSEFNVIESTKGWYRFASPFDLAHDDRAMAVNFGSLWVLDQRSGYSASVANFLKEYTGQTYAEVRQLIDSYDEAELNLTKVEKVIVESEVQLPPHFKSFILEDDRLAQRARKYLTSREFDPELLDSMGFGYCDDGDWFGFIVVPFKVNGILVYYLGRNFIDLGPDALRYKNPNSKDVGIGSKQVLFNEDALVTHDRVYLTEGWTDAMTMGEQGIASLSWSLSVRQVSKIINSSCLSIYIIADPGFYREALSNALKFVDYKMVYVINMDVLNIDANKAGKDVVMMKCEKALPLSFPIIIEKLTDL